MYLQLCISYTLGWFSEKEIDKAAEKLSESWALTNASSHDFAIWREKQEMQGR